LEKHKLFAALFFPRRPSENRIYVLVIKINERRIIVSLIIRSMPMISKKWMTGLKKQENGSHSMTF